MGERGWSLALLAVAACGRLRFEDRPMTGDGAGPAGDGAAIFYRENIPAAQALTVTVVADQMTYIDVAVAEYSGLPATGAFSGMATNACGACSNVDGGTLADGGLSVGVFTTANADVQSITMAPGWDGLASEATPLNAVMGAEDRIGTGNTLASWTTGFTGPKVGVSAKFGL